MESEPLIGKENSQHKAHWKIYCEKCKLYVTDANVNKNENSLGEHMKEFHPGCNFSFFGISPPWEENSYSRLLSPVTSEPTRSVFDFPSGAVIKDTEKSVKKSKSPKLSNFVPNEPHRINKHNPSTSETTPSGSPTTRCANSSRPCLSKQPALHDMSRNPFTSSPLKCAAPSIGQDECVKCPLAPHCTYSANLPLKTRCSKPALPCKSANPFTKSPSRSATPPLIFKEHEHQNQVDSRMNQQPSSGGTGVQSPQRQRRDPLETSEIHLISTFTDTQCTKCGSKGPYLCIVKPSNGIFWLSSCLSPLLRFVSCSCPREAWEIDVLCKNCQKILMTFESQKKRVIFLLK